MDSTSHTITSGYANQGPDEIFDSGLISPGGSFSLTFSYADNFPYFCVLHPWMSDVVTAKKPDKPSTQISLNIHPKEVPEGKTVTISGKLTSNGKGVGGETIYLKDFDSLDLVQDSIGKTVTDSNGNFKVNWIVRDLDSGDRQFSALILDLAGGLGTVSAANSFFNLIESSTVEVFAEYKGNSYYQKSKSCYNDCRNNIISITGTSTKSKILGMVMDSVVPGSSEAIRFASILNSNELSASDYNLVESKLRSAFMSELGIDSSSLSMVDMVNLLENPDKLQKYQNSNSVSKSQSDIQSKTDITSKLLAKNFRIVDQSMSKMINDEIRVSNVLNFAIDLKNSNNEMQPYTYLIQIQDSKGDTVKNSLVMISDVIQSGESKSPILSWIPTTSGTYTVTAFGWVGPQTPTAVFLPKSFTFQVLSAPVFVPAQPSISPKVYPVTPSDSDEGVTYESAHSKQLAQWGKINRVESKTFELQSIYKYTSTTTDGQEKLDFAISRLKAFESNIENIKELLDVGDNFMDRGKYSDAVSAYSKSISNVNDLSFKQFPIIESVINDAINTNDVLLISKQKEKSSTSDIHNQNVQKLEKAKQDRIQKEIDDKQKKMKKEVQSIQSESYQQLEKLREGVTDAENALKKASPDTPEQKEIIDRAWDKLKINKQKLEEVTERYQKGDRQLSYELYENAKTWYKFNERDNAEVGDNLKEISKSIEKVQKIQSQTCFLMWCW